MAMDIFWAPGIVLHAARCGWVFFLPLVALVGLALLFRALAPRIGRTARIGAPAYVILFLAIAWVLRDRQHILGDARLWIDRVRVLGLGIQPRHEPVIARLFGLTGSLLGDFLSVEDALAALSILAGILCAVALARLVRETLPPGDETRRVGTGLAFLLVFLQPMSFVFYGHVETYPVFAAILAFLLLSVSRDVRGGRLGMTTLLLFGLLCGGHVMGILIAPALGVLWYELRRRSRQAGGPRPDAAPPAGAARLRPDVVRSALLYLVPYGVLALVVAIVPSLRSVSVFDRERGALGCSPGYFGGVANAWFLVLCPAGLVTAARWFERRRVAHSSPGDPFGRFLLLALLPYLALPFAVPMILGPYRDLDLLTPAFIVVTFLGAHRAARAGAAAMDEVARSLAVGALFLAALLTLSICPLGIRVFEEALKRPDILHSGRSYGYETLGYYFRDHNDLDNGIRMLRAAIEVDPGNPRLRGPLGQFLLARGDTVEARSNLEMVVATPAGARFRTTLAEIHVRQGQPERAVALLAGHRAAALADAGQSAALAAAYLRIDLPESTLAVCQARLELAPDDPVAWTAQAAAYLRLDRGDEALAALRQAVALAPDNPEYRRRLEMVTRALSGQ